MVYYILTCERGKVTTGRGDVPDEQLIGSVTCVAFFCRYFFTFCTRENFLLNFFFGLRFNFHTGQWLLTTSANVIMFLVPFAFSLK